MLRKGLQGVNGGAAPIQCENTGVFSFLGTTPMNKLLAFLLSTSVLAFSVNASAQTPAPAGAPTAAPTASPAAAPAAAPSASPVAASTGEGKKAHKAKKKKHSKKKKAETAS